MKKNIISILSIALSIAFMGCRPSVTSKENSRTETGFVVQFPGKTSPRLAYSQDDVESYKIYLIKNSELVQEKSGAPGSTVRIALTSGGTYTLMVRAYDVNNKVIAEGSTEKSIELGDGYVKVEIVLVPKSKDAGFDVEIIWGKEVDSSEDPIIGPGESLTTVTLFDAATFTAPDGMEIVTLDGKKYLKVTVNGYSTSFTIPAVDCNEATTFKVDCRAAEAASAYQVIIGIKDSEYGDISTITMNPLKNEATELTGGVATSGEKLSTTKVASLIQPMAQNTEDWTAANGVVFYISKITAE